MVPCIACILRCLGWMDIRPSKTGRGSSWKPQNTGKVGNMATAPLGASRGFHFCHHFPRISSRNWNSPRQRTCSCQCRRQAMDDQPLTNTVSPEPPASISVGGVGTWKRSAAWRAGRSSGGPVPDSQQGGGRSLTMDMCTGQGLNSFLSHISSSVEPVPGFERLCLLGVD